MVHAKAKAAVVWCKNATRHGENPWTYLLITHDAIDEPKTLVCLAASYTFIDG